jgi:hypothetical protein
MVARSFSRYTEAQSYTTMAKILPIRKGFLLQKILVFPYKIALLLSLGGRLFVTIHLDSSHSRGTSFQLYRALQPIMGKYLTVNASLEERFALPSELLWSTARPNISRPAVQRAPSWSWASVGGEISYKWCPSSLQCSITILYCNVILP